MKIIIGSRRIGFCLYGMRHAGNGEVGDVSALEATMAGVIMGDATPNIIFKSVDGKLGITGIN